MKHEPRRFRPGRSWFALLLLILALHPLAAAQTLEFGVAATAGGGLAPHGWVRVEGVRPPAAAPATLAFQLRGPRPMVGLQLGTNQSFGPLGNLVFEAWTNVAEHPAGGTAAAEGAFSVRGVLGPAALRVALLGFGADVAAFRPADLASAERPTLQGPAGGLQLGLTYRVDRSVILEAEPELYLAQGGLALRTDARLRLLRALGPNELRLQLHGYATPGFGEWATAVGAAVTFPRGREPDITVGAGVGYSPRGLWPGATVRLGERIGPARLDLSAAFEPYRLDLQALRVRAEVTLPVAGWLPDGAELAVAGAVSSDLGLSGGGPTRAYLGTSLAFPVNLR